MMIVLYTLIYVLLKNAVLFRPSASGCRYFAGELVHCNFANIENVIKLM